MKIKEEFKKDVANIKEEELQKVIDAIDSENAVVFPTFALVYLFFFFIVVLLLASYQKWLAFSIILSIGVAIFAFFIIYFAYIYVQVKKLSLKEKAAFYLQRKWYKDISLISPLNLNEDDVLYDNIGLCYKNKFLKLKGFYIASIVVIEVLLLFVSFLFAFLETFYVLIFFIPLSLFIGFLLFHRFFKDYKNVKTLNNIELGKVVYEKDIRINGNNQKNFAKRRRFYIPFIVLFAIAFLQYGALFLSHNNLPNYQEMVEKVGNIKEITKEDNYIIHLENDETNYILLNKYVPYMEKDFDKALLNQETSLKVTPSEGNTSYVYYIKLNQKEILSEAMIKEGERKEVESYLTLSFVFMGFLGTDIIFFISDYFYTKVMKKRETITLNKE